MKQIANHACVDARGPHPPDRPAPHVVLTQMPVAGAALRELPTRDAVQLVVTYRSPLERKAAQPEPRCERWLQQRAGCPGDAVPYVAVAEGDVEASGQLRCGGR